MRRADVIVVPPRCLTPEAPTSLAARILTEQGFTAVPVAVTGSRAALGVREASSVASVDSASCGSTPVRHDEVRSGPVAGPGTGRLAMTGTANMSPIDINVEESGDPVPGVRLSLKPAGSTSGYVDGAWWPRSTDLASEVPALLAVLTDRMGRLERVSYDLAAWAPAGRRVTTGGVRIRLDGFRRRRPAHTVHVVSVDGDVVTLLVIPPAASPVDAEHALRRSGEVGNSDDIDGLLHHADGSAGEPTPPRRVT